MKLDCHQHFWSLANPFTRWPTPDHGPIFRDFGTDDLERHMIATGVTGTILVQAAPSVEETRYFLQIADESDFVKAVIGWIDFDAIGAVEQLRQLAQNIWFKGVRPMIQDIAAEGWVLQPRFAGIFHAIVETGLRFDALVRASQIAEIGRLARRYPDLPIVLDHAGKPPFAQEGMAGWTKEIIELGRIPSVYCTPYRRRRRSRDGGP